jgi:hypothetical protein
MLCLFSLGSALQIARCFAGPSPYDVNPNEDATEDDAEFDAEEGRKPGGCEGERHRMGEEGLGQREHGCSEGQTKSDTSDTHKSVGMAMLEPSRQQQRSGSDADLIVNS